MPNVTVITGGDLPPCPHCDRRLAFLVRFTFPDGTAELHLCRTCDTGATAGGRLLATMELPDDIRPADLFKEFTLAWMHEGLAAQGWQYIPRNDLPD
ncbi:hypothetical protein ACFYUY_01635 [Kitasatospora sp. NPDC004745]|uniref:hypothetical protein n=1 Tax=Kitasatospora sp. NPDC004745 TaxID=3364019 RepID=UPI0036A8D3CE